MNKFYILALFFTFLQPNAQVISGTVLAKEDQRPVPYARIGIEKMNTGTVSDEKGNFRIDCSQIPKNKNLMIEVSGFEAYKIPVEELVKTSPVKIFLQEKVKEIEAVILKPKKLADKNWGVHTKTKHVLFSVNPELRKDEYLRETAVEFKTGKRAKILKINLNIASMKSDKPIVLRYSIYNDQKKESSALLYS